LRFGLVFPFLTLLLPNLLSEILENLRVEGVLPISISYKDRG